MTDTRNDLESILETCLEQLRTGRWTVEECLAHYPDQREGIAPLLRTASQLQSAGSVKPSPAFRAAAQARMAARLQHSRRPSPARVTRPARSQLPRRLVGYAVALMIVLILAAGSTGTIYAADGSLPGQPLYGVKLAVEQAQLDVASPAQATGLRIKFAGKRLDEAELLVARGDDQGVAIALAGYDQLVADIAQFLDSTGGDAQSIQVINDALSNHQAHLEALLAKAPEAAKKGISQAIAASKHGQARAAEARSKHGGKPKQSPTSEPTEAEAGTDSPGQPSVQSTEPSGGQPTDHPGGGNSGSKGKPTDTPGNGPPANPPGGGNGKGQPNGQD